jgi:hypothetical protein
MTAVINTVNIKLDITPAMWLSDQRIQSLPNSAAYINLLCHAAQLNATTGSEYINGHFSRSKALKRVPGVTEEALDELVEADLVTQVKEDRWAVEFPNPQTSHDDLQKDANSRARGAETRRSQKVEAKQAAQDEAERVAAKRSNGAQRQTAYRDRQATADVVDINRELPPLVELADHGKALAHSGTYAAAKVADNEPPF